MKQYLNQLNEAQLAPTLQKEGPMIVIAGAGSGKTRVLTYRIAYLMSEGVDPFNILSLTFTNKAAREMKDTNRGDCWRQRSQKFMDGNISLRICKDFTN